MKNLIIIGARGWGREVLWSFQKSPRCGKDYTIKGFLDDKADALNGLIGNFPPILNSVEDYEIEPEDIFFCALGDPFYRKKYAEIIEQKGGTFITYISPKAIISPNSIIEEGSFIGSNSVISDNVIVGKHCMIHGMCTLGHDVSIKDYVSIEAYSFFGGYSFVDELSSIHVRSTILRNIQIGKNCSVGAGSVVIKNVKDGLHVFGNPATKI